MQSLHDVAEAPGGAAVEPDVECRQLQELGELGEFEVLEKVACPASLFLSLT